ncbi:DUF1214 domain-containing protein [Zhongshania aquimaris]|uniref:DUF1214 domain-containing protein n=1 Tax=Zhongshania aquimaris TaxID=2857107 RepID=A0ABS6VNJ2_9GAMM|nr:DUF1214 domain-containing protein [Zhongshania aquimaris]MBW2939888.1 DUF1214 domain-containing protein [Zhongshania aquimaris]
MRVLNITVTFGLGIAIGAWSASLMLKHQLDLSSVRNGPWRTLLTTGAADAGMYQRAGIAVGGLLALSKQETLYYTAFEDNSGNQLQENCTYRILGKDPDARWWSLTAYADDHYLPQNDDNALSIAKTTVERDDDGHFEIMVSAKPQPKNWISSRAAGEYSLTLRLYNPSSRVYEAPAAANLPNILRENCQ